MLRSGSAPRRLTLCARAAPRLVAAVGVHGLGHRLRPPFTSVSPSAPSTHGAVRVAMRGCHMSCEGPAMADPMAVDLWSRPLPERLAAVTVAKYMLKGDDPSRPAQPASSCERTVHETVHEDTEGATAAGVGVGVSMGVQPLPPTPEAVAAMVPAVYGAMPLRLFVARVPGATRDAIFASRRDVKAFVEGSALLELVYQHEDGRITAGTAEAVVVDDGGAAEPSPSASYGPLVHVRVRGGEVAAAALLRAVMDPTAGEAAAPSAPPCADARSLSEEPAVGQACAVDPAVAADACATDPAAASLDGGLTLREADAIVSTLASVLARRADGPAGSRYMMMNEAFLAFMREAGRHPADTTLHHLAHNLTLDRFEELLLEAARGGEADGDAAATARAACVRQRLWVMHGRFLAARAPEDGDTPPPFTNPQPRVRSAAMENNYGGWGGADAVPTRDDVYEILKYVPVNWGNLGAMQIPAAVKKRHIRASSMLQWLRRQPYYFEVRNMGRTVEIRRSCVLHPEAHGMTAAEARERLELAIATGEANNLVLLKPDGTPQEAGMSPTEQIFHKFLMRVCPPYFAPLSLVMQRYTKKNLTEPVLLELARRRPAEFEVLHSRYADVPLVRRRVGADSRRWRDAFVADLEQYPADVRGIVMVMNRLCPSWDRPEYVYVRLSPAEQRAVGGYDGMMELLRRHPSIFRVGRHFVSRVDSSDPFAAQEAEPDLHDMTSRTYLREENPYLSPADVAAVFHYVAPADAPCTAAFFVECASPAMRVALPPRVVTLLQLFPRLFACTETAPGVYAIRKLLPRSSTPAPAAVAAGEGAPARAAAAEADALRELEAELAAEEQLTRPQLLAAVRELVPASTGVEGAQLLLWASMSVQRAANHHYGGLLKLVDAERAHFRVVDRPDSKMIYRRGEGEG